MGLFDDLSGAVFGDDRNPNPEAHQFSTGAQPTPVDEDWKRFDFGFTARSVNIRSDSEIIVSFDKPWTNPSSHIRLRSEDLPFSVGGETPVSRERVFVRAVDGTAQIEIIAL